MEKSLKALDHPTATTYRTNNDHLWTKNDQKKGKMPCFWAPRALQPAQDPLRRVALDRLFGREVVENKDDSGSRGNVAALPRTIL